MSNTMTQGEAVFQAVCATIGEIEGKVTLNAEQKKQVHALVLTAFLSGQTVHSNKSITEAELNKYIPGLVNNWLRKDTRLTAGAKYETKRPGSRAGSTDESLKAMRALRTSTTDTNQLALIDEAIAARQAELKPVKVINVEALPPQLRKFVQA